jgi:hypothetical protein
MSHELNGFWAEDAHIAELAAIEDHLAEARVVRHAGSEPGAAREELLRAADGIIGGIGKRILGDRRVGKTIKAFIRIVGVSGGQAIDFVVRRKEKSIFHSEWLENTGAEAFVDRHPRNHFDQAPKNINTQAVLPTLARIEQERHGG